MLDAHGFLVAAMTSTQEREVRLDDRTEAALACDRCAADHRAAVTVAEAEAAGALAFELEAGARVRRDAFGAGWRNGR